MEATVNIPKKMVRTLDLPADEEIDAALTFYPPQHVIEPHCHDLLQVSFLLAGEMSESIGGHYYEVLGSAVGCKRTGSVHSDRYGTHGALLLAINVSPDLAPLVFNRIREGWRPQQAPECVTARLVRAAVATEHPSTRAELLWDALSDLGDPGGPSVAAAPLWLLAVRDELRDSEEPPSISVLAKRIGIDRTQLARTFLRHFGISPSVYRLRCMTAQALANAMSSGDTLTSLAHTAGFSDQSHFARAVRADTGLTASSLRALLG